MPCKFLGISDCAILNTIYTAINQYLESVHSSSLILWQHQFLKQPQQNSMSYPTSLKEKFHLWFQMECRLIKCSFTNFRFAYATV